MDQGRSPHDVLIHGDQSRQGFKHLHEEATLDGERTQVVGTHESVFEGKPVASQVVGSSAAAFTRSS